MNTLDLSPFHGIDPSCLSAVELDILRTTFASTVVDYAATCTSNKQLLDALMFACDPNKGLHLLRMLGQGSTRRVYQLPFDLALKLERHDKLDPAEMAWRGSERYLYWRRRIAMSNELSAKVVNPSLLPPIYGALLRFGISPPNPALIISERVDALRNPDPEDTEGISFEHLYKSATTGELLVLDPRFSKQTPRPEEIHPDLRLDKVFPGGDWGMWTENLGVGKDGRFYLLDAGNVMYKGLVIDGETLLPKLDKWVTCEETTPLHLKQTIQLSREMCDYVSQQFTGHPSRSLGIQSRYDRRP